MAIPYGGLYRAKGADTLRFRITMASAIASTPSGSAFSNRSTKPPCYRGGEPAGVDALSLTTTIVSGTIPITDKGQSQGHTCAYARPPYCTAPPAQPCTMRG